MLTAHLIRLAAGIPALVVVALALWKSSDRLHPLVWALAAVTAGAPLATGYVWTRSSIEGLLYGLLTYAAAAGFAIRLTHERLPFSYHRPLLLLFMASAVTAFVMVPLVVMPAVREMSVAVDFDESDPDGQVQAALRDIDSALRNIETEQQTLHHGVSGVLQQIKQRSARIRQLQDRRDKVMDELSRVEPLRQLTRAQIAALTEQLHKSQVMDNVISFFIGIASSITAMLAAKFFAQSN